LDLRIFNGGGGNAHALLKINSRSSPMQFISLCYFVQDKEKLVMCPTFTSITFLQRFLSDISDKIF